MYFVDTGQARQLRPRDVCRKLYVEDDVLSSKSIRSKSEAEQSQGKLT